MGLQIRQKLSSLGPMLALDAPSPTGSWRVAGMREDVQAALGLANEPPALAQAVAF